MGYGCSTFYKTVPFTASFGGAVAWWLTPRTPDPEVGVRAPLGSPCCVLEQDIFTPQKYSPGSGCSVPTLLKNCFPGR